jgi:hypothetical protein
MDSVLAALNTEAFSIGITPSILKEIEKNSENSDQKMAAIYQAIIKREKVLLSWAEKLDAIRQKAPLELCEEPKIKEMPISQIHNEFKHHQALLGVCHRYILPEHQEIVRREISEGRVTKRSQIITKFRDFLNSDGLEKDVAIMLDSLAKIEEYVSINRVNLFSELFSASPTSEDSKSKLLDKEISPYSVIVSDEGTYTIQLPEDVKGGKFLGSGAYKAVSAATTLFSSEKLATAVSYDTKRHSFEYSKNEYAIYQHLGDSLGSFRARTAISYQCYSYSSYSTMAHAIILPFTPSLDKIPIETISSEDKKSVILSSCNSLSKIHEKNVIHRDIKPENIGVKRDPQGRLIASPMDFGISLDTESESYEAEKDTQRGSPQYTDPAPVLEPEKYKADKKNDVWSMGLTLLEIIQPNHERVKKVQSVKFGLINFYIDLKAKKHASLLTDKQASLDKRYTIIQRMLSFDPTDRPTMAEVKTELTEIYKTYGKEIAEKDAEYRRENLEIQMQSVEEEIKPHREKLYQIEEKRRAIAKFRDQLRS